MAFNKQPIQLPHPEEYLQKGPLLLTTFRPDVQQYYRDVVLESYKQNRHEFDQRLLDYIPPQSPHSYQIYAPQPYQQPYQQIQQPLVYQQYGPPITAGYPMFQLPQYLPQAIGPQMPYVYGQLPQPLYQQMVVQQQPQYAGFGQQEEDRGALFEAGLPGPQIQRPAKIQPPLRSLQPPEGRQPQGLQVVNRQLNKEMKFNNNISVKNCISVEVNIDRPTVPLSQQTLIAITELIDIPYVAQRRPGASILVVTYGYGPNETTEWHAIAYDRAETGYLFASRVITNDSFLSNQNNSKFLVVENDRMTPSREYDLTNGGQGIRDRVLIVVHNGWLSVFGPKRCYLLLEKEYLVFSDSNDNILFRRIFDTKRLDGQEIFLKQNLLQCIQESRVCDGMFILHACCQQDTAQNGVYVVTGDGISIVNLAYSQVLVTRRAGEDKQYYDHTVAGPTDQGVGGAVGGHVSPVRGQSPKRIQVRAQSLLQRSPQRAQGIDQRRGGHQQQRYEDYRQREPQQLHRYQDFEQRGPQQGFRQQGRGQRGRGHYRGDGRGRDEIKNRRGGRNRYNR